MFLLFSVFFSWIVIALTSEYYALRSLFIFIPLILTSIFLIVKKNLCLISMFNAGILTDLSEIEISK